MKKLIAVILTVFIFTSLIASFSVISSAGGMASALSESTVPDECTITLEDTLRYSDFKVRISIDNNPGIWGYEGKLYYNSEALQCTAVTAGNVFTSEELVSNTEEAGVITFVFTCDALDNTVTDGVIITFSFTVLDKTLPFDIEYSFRNDIDICALDTVNLWPVAVNPVIVNNIDYVTDIVYGDVNGDGKINSKDSKLFKQYQSSPGTVTIVFANCDFNGDGKITSKDAREFKKLLSSN